MALDTRLPLLAESINITPPDYPKLAMLAQEMAGMQDVQRQRRFMLSELLRERQNELGAQQYLGQMQQPGTLPRTMAEQVPQAPPGTYAQPASRYSQLTPDTQAPPGETTYTRAPTEMQPPALTTPARPAPAPSAEGLLGYGKPGQQMLLALQRARAGDAEAQKDIMDVFLKKLDLAEPLLSLAQDQASYDKVRGVLQQQFPEFTLPEQYDKDALAKIQRGLAAARSKAAGGQNRVSLEVQMGRRGGELVPLQTTGAGEMVESKMPEGVSYVGPTRTVDTPTEKVTYNALGEVIARTPKDVRGAAFERAVGAETGEQAGKFPEQRRAAVQELFQLDQKHRTVTENIDRILGIMKAANLPTTGFWGDNLSRVSGTSASNVNELLKTIRANLGLEELRSLAAAGGKLGQVTEGEHRLLQDVSAALAQRLTAPEFIYELERVRRNLGENRAQRQAAFEEKFGSGRSPQRPPGTSETSPAAKTITRQQGQQLMQEQGLTPEQFEQVMRQRHYRYAD